MLPSTASKPFRTYAELISILAERGMQVDDAEHAKQKLAQLGYYRLSGFWYPARQFQVDDQHQQQVCAISKKPLRLDRFQTGTVFDDAVALYQFDKSLRMLMLDAIEHLEVHLKTVIAHEVGYHDPVAYTKSTFILGKWTQPYTDRQGKPRNKWLEWSKKQHAHIVRSQEDCIRWHVRANKCIPIWVAVEAWDFGDLSEYFELLGGKYQNVVMKRLGLADAKVFSRWLQQLSHLRNRCAHHTRVWNQVAANALSVPVNKTYFQKLQLDQPALKRLYGLISVMWFLLQRIAPESTWILKIADLIDRKPTLPGCTYASMGFSSEAGFPRALFDI